MYDKLNWVNFVLRFEDEFVVSNMLNQLKGTCMSLWPATGKDTIC